MSAPKDTKKIKGKKEKSSNSKLSFSVSAANKKDTIKLAVRFLKKAFLIIVLVVGLYLVLMPILPQIFYYFRQIGGYEVYDRHLTDTSFTLSDASTDEKPGNWVIIPKIGVETPIIEGETEDALDEGAWHRPDTGSPDRGGNTVITGHRFKYLPPNNLTFYHLDKLEKGDQIIVSWEGIEYYYVTSEVFVVEPDRVDIEADTAQPRLTLYTCTPLWTAEKRLVVVAEPDVDESEDVELEDIDETSD